MTGTEVAERSPTELEELSPDAQELMDLASADSKADPSPVLPRVLLSQQLSDAVVRGKARSGEYVNSLTDRNYGTEVEFVVVYVAKGRFFDGKKAGIFTALGEVAPSNWPEQYAGRRFDELPDAEETFREAANAEGGEWGDGPPIQTQWNFIGFVTDEPSIPARIAMKSTATRTATKLRSVLDFTLSAYWYQAVKLGSQEKRNSEDQPYYVPTVELGRKTTAEERQTAEAMIRAVAKNLTAFQLQGEDKAGESKSEALRAKVADAAGGDDLEV